MGKPSSNGGGGHFALPRPLDHWYIACRADALGTRPIRRRLFGTPIALFRDGKGRPAALLDRCAHRNVPLSAGRVVGDQVECPYHGWRFGRDRFCCAVPALVGRAEGKARHVPAHATREQQGYIWVFGRADAESSLDPYHIPYVDDRRYGVVHYEHTFEASLIATAENILDVPHTAFLHRGLFRGGKANRIIAVVRRAADRVEAEFLGEPRPQGLAARILAPGGGELSHFDRFILPSVAQVEYALGESSHIVLTSILTPEEDFVTHLNAVATFRLPLASGLIRRIMMPIARRILEQDAVMLRAQTAAIHAFGGEQFASTAVDLLGPHIRRLLRQAERGESPPQGAATEERVELNA